MPVGADVPDRRAVSLTPLSPRRHRSSRELAFCTRTHAADPQSLPTTLSLPDPRLEPDLLLRAVVSADLPETERVGQVAVLDAVNVRAPVDRCAPGSYARLAACHGRTGLAPFLTSADAQVVDLQDGRAAAGFVKRRHWAVTPGDVIAPPALVAPALSEYLGLLHERALRPVFMATGDPAPYLECGFSVSEIADEALIDLPSFSLEGKARAGVRHAVAAAQRIGLTMVDYQTGLEEQLAPVSQQWLATKRGGEFGFTLSRHQDVRTQLADGCTDLWAVADVDGRLQAWCTWRHYLDGHGRVLDIMRRRPDAPNPAMDFLLARTLMHYRDIGVQIASLASVPRPHGTLAERIYPCQNLRAYKQKFDPTWQSRWMAVPASWQRPFALAAICGAYCPGGLRRAVTRNS